MIKFRLYFDKDKETSWLDEMADKGYAMTGFFAGFYSFEKCEPGEYRYQVDFADKPFALSKNYRDFMTEMEIEIVQQWFFWIILRKKANKGKFQLYTDVDSSITHYKKIRRMFKIVTILEIICFVTECLCAAMLHSQTKQLLPVIFSFILAAILIALLRTVVSINRIIFKLQERKGELSDKDVMRNSRISPCLTAGLLLNVCAMIMDEGISSYIKYSVQILAIIFMLIGIYQTRHIFYKD